MFTLQLAIITVLGAVMCFCSLCTQAAFLYYKIDQGEIAQIQAYSVWCAAIAVIGHVINAFGQSSSSVHACLTEAVTGNFGELALVLWQMGTAVIAIAITYPEWLRSGNNRRNLMISMHLLVWIPSLITTIIPWSQGILGLNADNSTDFCWFVPGNKGWELGQFYIPLYVASFVALSTFVFLVHRIKQLRMGVAPRAARSASITAQNSSAPTSAAHSEYIARRASKAEQIQSESSDEFRQILVRLAFQLFVLSFVFLPDSFSYFVALSGNEVADWVYSLTTFIWKLESSLVCAIWMSNARVKDSFFKIPFVKSVRNSLCPVVAPPVVGESESRPSRRSSMAKKTDKSASSSAARFAPSRFREHSTVRAQRNSCQTIDLRSIPVAEPQPAASAPVVIAPSSGGIDLRIVTQSTAEPTSKAQTSPVVIAGARRTSFTQHHRASSGRGITLSASAVAVRACKLDRSLSLNAARPAVSRRQSMPNRTVAVKPATQRAMSMIETRAPKPAHKPRCLRPSTLKLFSLNRHSLKSTPAPEPVPQETTVDIASIELASGPPSVATQLNNFGPNFSAVAFEPSSSLASSVRGVSLVDSIQSPVLRDRLQGILHDRAAVALSSSSADTYIQTQRMMSLQSRPQPTSPATLVSVSRSRTFTPGVLLSHIQRKNLLNDKTTSK